MEVDTSCLYRGNRLPKGNGPLPCDLFGRYLSKLEPPKVPSGSGSGPLAFPTHFVRPNSKAPPSWGDVCVLFIKGSLKNVMFQPLGSNHIVRTPCHPPKSPSREVVAALGLIASKSLKSLLFPHPNVYSPELPNRQRLCGYGRLPGWTRTSVDHPLGWVQNTRLRRDYIGRSLLGSKGRRAPQAHLGLPEVRLNEVGQWVHSFEALGTRFGFKVADVCLT